MRYYVVLQMGVVDKLYNNTYHHIYSRIWCNLCISRPNAVLARLWFTEFEKVFVKIDDNQRVKFSIYVTTRNSRIKAVTTFQNIPFHCFVWESVKRHSVAVYMYI